MSKKLFTDVFIFVTHDRKQHNIVLSFVFFIKNLVNRTRIFIKEPPRFWAVVFLLFLIALTTKILSPTTTLSLSNPLIFQATEAAWLLFRGNKATPWYAVNFRCVYCTSICIYSFVWVSCYSFCKLHSDLSSYMLRRRVFWVLRLKTRPSRWFRVLKQKFELLHCLL